MLMSRASVAVVWDARGSKVGDRFAGVVGARLTSPSARWIRSQSDKHRAVGQQRRHAFISLHPPVVRAGALASVRRSTAANINAGPGAPVQTPVVGKDQCRPFRVGVVRGDGNVRSAHDQPTAGELQAAVRAGRPRRPGRRQLVGDFVRPPPHEGVPARVRSNPR
jgi:hypothetical protein